MHVWHSPQHTLGADMAINCVILQPSFVPWRGYFHQIHKADVFVFYDCVQFDKHGWRNRNRIKTSTGSQWLTVPVKTAGTYDGLPIRDVMIAGDGKWRRKHLTTWDQNYRKAPYYDTYRGILERIYGFECERLVDLNCHSTELIAEALGMTTPTFVRSSTLDVKGQKTDRLIDVLNKVGATHYISGPSARDYIEVEQFEHAGITLEFMSYEYPPYPQLHGAFEGGVSVLDLLFNTGSNAAQHIWSTPTAPPSPQEGLP